MRSHQPMTPERAAELGRAFQRAGDALRRLAKAVMAAVARLGELLRELTWDRHPDAQVVCFHDDPATEHAGLTLPPLEWTYPDG